MPYSVSILLRKQCILLCLVISDTLPKHGCEVTIRLPARERECRQVDSFEYFWTSSMVDYGSACPYNTPREGQGLKSISAKLTYVWWDGSSENDGGGRQKRGIEIVAVPGSSEISVPRPICTHETCCCRKITALCPTSHAPTA